MLIPKLNTVFIYTCNGKYSKKDIKRFLKYIKINKETGCWEWTGSLRTGGYGQYSIVVNGKHIIIGTHRAAFEMATGILVPDGMCVLHHCDNRKCVNILMCLFMGTNQDNIDDKVNKRRQTIGENHGMAKLTLIQVIEIRRLYATKKYSQRKLAKIFNIGFQNISDIINNKLWHDHDYIPDKSIDYRNKLNQEQVNNIRKDWNTGEYTQQQLANKFGVTHSNISLILSNRIWKDSLKDHGPLDQIPKDKN
jgi:transcriptional regulator with XRE-family HTH domain